MRKCCSPHGDSQRLSRQAGLPTFRGLAHRNYFHRHVHRKVLCPVRPITLGGEMRETAQYNASPDRRCGVVVGADGQREARCLPLSRVAVLASACAQQGAAVPPQAICAGWATEVYAAPAAPTSPAASAATRVKHARETRTRRSIRRISDPPSIRTSWSIQRVGCWQPVCPV
jgi:hypothetical protein